jgi:hypothetical protein
MISHLACRSKVGYGSFGNNSSEVASAAAWLTRVYLNPQGLKHHPAIWHRGTSSSTQAAAPLLILYLLSCVAGIVFVVFFSGLTQKKRLASSFCAPRRGSQASGFSRAGGLGDIIYYNWTSSAHRDSLQRTITCILHIAVKCTIRNV